MYKVTNIKDNKFYIGVHKTKNENDGYFGSGKYLKRAIVKHGLENFVKVTLEYFSSVKEMYAKEKHIVDKEFIRRKDTYNLKLGGRGGFDYINENIFIDYVARAHASNAVRRIRMETDPIFKQKRSDDSKRSAINRMSRGELMFGGKRYDRTGMKHSETTKMLISEKSKLHQAGKGNSQYGTMWIYNCDTFETSKIKNTEPVPEGYSIGKKPKINKPTKLRTIYKMDSNESMQVKCNTKTPTGWLNEFQYLKLKFGAIKTKKFKDDPEIKRKSLYVDNVILHIDLRKLWNTCKDFDEFKVKSNYTKSLSSLQEAFSRFIFKRDPNKEHYLIEVSSEYIDYHLHEIKKPKRPISEETRQKHRNANQRNNTPERNAKISKTKKGTSIKLHSEQHKSGLSAANKGKIKITNELVTLTIKESELEQYLSEGWRRGYKPRAPN